MSNLFETNLSGKTVAITGASRGIGAETAKLFGQSGAKVALLARSGADLKSVAGSIGEAARAYPCDLGELYEIAPIFNKIKAELGHIDILINNGALIAPIARMGEADLDAWDNLMRVNVIGLFATTKACLPDMMARGVGTVINISSGAAKNAYEGWSAYCASKAAVAMLTQS
ncbi:MAG: SDR family oxidoreductase, partial [Paracoccaceae bacterium]